MTVASFIPKLSIDQGYEITLGHIMSIVQGAGNIKSLLLDFYFKGLDMGTLYCMQDCKVVYCIL